MELKISEGSSSQLQGVGLYGKANHSFALENDTNSHRRHPESIQTSVTVIHLLCFFTLSLGFVVAIYFVCCLHIFLTLYHLFSQ